MPNEVYPILYHMYNRSGALSWLDFKDNNKDKIIFECISQHLLGPKYPYGQICIQDITKKIALFESEPDTNGVITEGELENFLEAMKSDENYSDKFKNITLDDLKAFFDKMVRLNPTNFEKNVSVLQSLEIKDDAETNIVSEDMLSNFSEDTPETTVFDSKRNVKKSFEIFDLNNDGKIDSIEAEYFFNSKNKLNIKDVGALLKNLDKLGEEDGSITNSERVELYKRLSAESEQRAKERYRLNFAELEGFELATSFNKPLVTPQLRNMFANGVSEISFDNIVNSGGKLKKGFELFDLNDDGMLDEVEKSFFSTGGKMIKDDSNTLTLCALVSSLKALDYFDNKTDGKTDSFYQIGLYNYISAAHFIEDELENFNPEAKEMYIQQMYDIDNILNLSSDDSLGVYYNARNGEPSSIALSNSYNRYDLAGTLLHELTHAILHKLSNDRMPAIAQEVQTFFVKSLFMDYVKAKFDDARFNFGACYLLNADYHELKERYPDIDDIDIAKALFVQHAYDNYKDIYHAVSPHDDIYKEKYYQIGGFFKQTRGKFEIYKAGINSALSEIKLKYGDAGGLNTYAIMMLFTPEKPIITASDLVDSKGCIKRGLEVFDLDGDGKLSFKEKEKFKYISYSDLPKIFDEVMGTKVQP